MIGQISLPRQHAIVIGAGMSGLLAARVLAKHFSKVTIVDRDQIPLDPAMRVGTPQAHHIHFLLKRGYDLYSGYFPGFEEDLREANANLMDWGADFRWYYADRWRPSFETAIKTYVCGRPLMEWVVRRRLMAHPNVEVLDRHEALGLIANGDKTRVTGVLLRRHGADPKGAGSPFAADLVVDASGYASRSPGWLASLGYPAPPESKVDTEGGRASRFIRIPRRLQEQINFVYVQSRPSPRARSGGVIRIENETWIASLFGVSQDYPPSDEAGFLEFARSLPHPIVYEAIRESEPISPIRTYRRNENRVRHYEALGRWPKGFITVGDGLCVLNPIYAQGMTLAALDANALDETLSSTTGNGAAFQRKAAAANRGPWLIASTEDCLFLPPDALRSLRSRIMQRYMGAVMLAANQSSMVYLSVLYVLSLLKPTKSLLHPGIVLRTALWALSRLLKGQ